MNTPRPSMNISAVERVTGLGKDTLRVWERRYGFPTPARDEHGERIYPAEQVDRLRLIKRLIDQGHRPGRLVGADDEQLVELTRQASAAERTPGAAPAPPGEDAAATTAHRSAPLIEAALAQLRAHQPEALRQTLNQAMLRQGLQQFIIDTVGPLNVAVGDAWMRGEIEVFEEHLYTEQIKTLLRQAMTTLPGNGASPRVVLTTLPDELHTLGLLMVQALLALDGATCIALGAQTPLFDVGLAARAHRADIVALSFSGSFNARQVAPLVAQLRELLPASVELWIGGGGADRVRPTAGVCVLSCLDAALAALDAWRQRSAAAEEAGRQAA